MPQGFVSLVGAGPGHPDFLTIKGLRRLQEADLVLHDALVSDAVCALATKALRINVGKRAGREQTPQREIERLLIEGAEQGLKVVRLKGGDPFVFGRGGEEALALQHAGIPFEIVPGVTTAIAAPALAGIPVTHRDVSPGFMVLTGTDLESIDRVLGSIAPGALTLVVLMGIGARDRIASRLLARGWSAATPAAIVLGASTPDMWTWRGSIVTLGSIELADSGAPGTIVIGDVAALPIAATDLKDLEHVPA
jgi:uroporphyrin-III C-methyltransferase